MKSSINHIIAIILVMFILPNSAFAKGEPKQKLGNDSKPTKQYQCKLISRADAIRQAKKQLDGKVVGVQLSENGARSVYRVRMLVGDKRVKTISIRACR